MNKENFVRLSMFVKFDKRAAFSHLLEANPDLVVSWGEKVKQGGTTFHITLFNARALWDLSQAWANALNPYAKT